MSAVAGGHGGCEYGFGDGDPGTIHRPSFVTDTPSITGLANDTGRYADDLLTNDPTIQGTAEPDSAIKLYVGDDVVGNGQSDPSTGEFQVMITGSVVDDLLEVTATAQEPCANESAPSEPVWGRTGVHSWRSLRQLEAERKK